MPFLPQKTVPLWRKYNCVREGLFCSRPAFTPRIYSQQMAHDFSEAVFPQIQMPSGRDNVIFIVLTLPLCHVSLHRKRNPSLKGPMLVIRGPIKGCEVSSVLHFWLLPTFPPIVQLPSSLLIVQGRKWWDWAMLRGTKSCSGGRLTRLEKEKNTWKKRKVVFLHFCQKPFLGCCCSWSLTKLRWRRPDWELSNRCRAINKEQHHILPLLKQRLYYFDKSTSFFSSILWFCQKRYYNSNIPTFITKKRFVKLSNCHTAWYSMSFHSPELDWHWRGDPEWLAWHCRVGPSENWKS